MYIQMILLVGVPFMFIYTGLILSYGYRKGFKDGLEIAKMMAQVAEENKAETE